MKIYIGSDHRGFQLKNVLYKELKMSGFDVVDVGPQVYEKEDDYVDVGMIACGKMNSEDRAILLCGSGHGMDIVANKHKEVRCVLGFNLDVVVQGRTDEDANVLSLPSDWLTEDEAVEMVKTFLSTDFSNAERHIRRIEKISKISE